MKLLTLDEIEAASHDLKSAIKCDIKQWGQILELGPKRYKQACEGGLTGVDRRWSAMCRRDGGMFPCGRCPMLETEHCCLEYEAAYEYLQPDKMINPRKNWTFEEGEVITAMVDKLKSCLERQK